MSDAGPPADGGWFGTWATDVDGLPCFDVDPMLRSRADSPPAVLPVGGLGACWHQIGGYGLVATAHAGGWTSLYATSRGMVRLTGPASSWGMGDATTDAVRVRFGLGYAEWRATSGGWSIVRRVSAAATVDPVLRVDVWLQPPDGASAREASTARYEERWVPEPQHLLVGALMSPYRRPPAGYTGREALTWRALFGLSAGVRAATGFARRAVAARLVTGIEVEPEHRALVIVPRRSVPPDPPTRPAWVDLSLPSLVVASLDDDRSWSAGGATLAVEIGGPAHLAFAVALADDRRDIGRLLGVARAQSAATNVGSWASLLDLELHGAAQATGGAVDRDPAEGVGAAPGSAPFGREARWHAAYLAGAQQPDALFGQRYVAQGSAYGFVHGLQGAPRDYAISSVPLSVIDPEGARQLLRVMLAMTSPGGTIHYAHTGRGQCTSGGIHAAPTDLPIFLLWAVTEYVFATGDRVFLDEEVRYSPPGRGRSSTVRARLLQAFAVLRERVGGGPHGLLRVGSGDWADPISAMVPDRRAFHHQGESGFNTAFACYVLPRVAALLEADPADDPAAGGAAAEMRSFAAALRGAMELTWTGRWFLRGYDGTGGPIGEDHLFVDGQVWALIAGIGTDEQRATLVDELWSRCDEPSPIGATILDRPHPVHLGMLAPGWDCNGGVWAAINGLLAWGYALHDPERAWANLHKQSLAAHAASYPHVWYGIWSGPDAYNAHFGEQPGETFVQPATPMQEFPVMNSNAHAGPLLALLRVLGVEADPEQGLVVRDRGPDAPAFTLDTPLGRLERTPGPRG